jgi:hypothetical protein
MDAQVPKKAAFTLNLDLTRSSLAHFAEVLTQEWDSGFAGPRYCLQSLGIG